MTDPNTDPIGALRDAVRLLEALKERVDKIEAFVTDGAAAWPMPPISKQLADDKAALAKLMGLPVDA